MLIVRPAVSILLACLVSGGCSSTARQPEGGSAGAPESTGLRAAPAVPTGIEAQANQLRDLAGNGGREPLARQRAAYALARLLQRGGSRDGLEQAAILFEQASGDRPLARRCRWHQYEAFVALGNETSARQALAAFAGGDADAETRAAASYALAQSYMRAGETAAAREEFEKLQAAHPQSEYAIGADYYLGDLALGESGKADNGDGLPRALAHWRRYLTASPAGTFALAIVERLQSLPAYRATAADLTQMGRAQFAQGNWAAALSAFDGAGAGDRLWYPRAVCLLRLGKRGEARVELERGIAAHPDDESLPAAAETLTAMLDRERSLALWRKIAASGTSYGDLALFNVARRSAAAQALALYRELLRRYPHSEYAPESSWWLFWSEYKAADRSAAHRRAVAALSAYPKARAAARFAFWIGKIHEGRGEREPAKRAYETAARLHPADYYGHRARARHRWLAGGHTDRGWSILPARKHPNPAWDWPAPPALIAWSAVEEDAGATLAELARIEQFDECAQLLPPGRLPILRAYLFSRLGLPLDAINTAARGLSGAPSPEKRWQLAYPLFYGQPVAREAKANGMDPLLVHALIREESRYDWRALSRSHAVGLMQLLRGTAYGVAKRLGVPLAGVEDIYRPDNNIKLGVDYLTLGIKRSGGAMQAVAGYNGGPNAVRSWMSRFRQTGGSDLDVFVEDIPYRETRDYVRKVFASYWNYERVYQP